MELLSYKVPVDKMQKVVNEEIVLARMTHGDLWMNYYYNNFHFFFPYIRDGEYHKPYNMESVKDKRHESFAEIFGLQTKMAQADPKNSELFLGMTPEELEIVRIACEQESGVTEACYLPQSKQFYEAYDADVPNWSLVRENRNALFSTLEPIWVRMRAFGFMREDLIK